MFFERLELLCSKNGTTITALLKKLNLSTSKGTAWRSGSVPNGEILLAIASYFETTTDYLLGKTDDPRLPESKEIRDEDIQFALFDGTKEITPEMFEEVKAFAKFVQNREAEKGKGKKKD